MQSKMNHSPQKETDVENRFKGMSPERKLMLSLKLYHSSRELKEASLRIFHPDWDNDKIMEEVRKIFLYART